MLLGWLGRRRPCSVRKRWGWNLEHLNGKEGASSVHASISFDSKELTSLATNILWPISQPFAIVPCNVREAFLAELYAVLRGDAGGSRVDPDGVFDIAAITAGNRHHDRQAHLASLLEHNRISARQAIEGEGQATQAIALVGIGAGQVHNEIRSRRRDGVRQRSGQQLEVRVVTGPVAQLDVEASSDFVERVVFAAVHAERENALVAGEDRVGPVPLVDIEVHDERASDSAVSLQRAYRDRGVVENAKALAVRRERVVRSARQVHGDPVLRRERRRLERSTGRAVRSLDERRRPGEAEAPFLVRGEATAREAVDIVRGVNEQKIRT